MNHIAAVFLAVCFAILLLAFAAYVVIVTKAVNADMLKPDEEEKP